MDTAYSKEIAFTVGNPDLEGGLVAAAKAGDEAAFEELVNRNARKIFRAALKITKNREDAGDATQCAFLKSFEHLGEFHGESKFSTWITRIVVNEGLMKLRKERFRKEVAIDAVVDEQGESIRWQFKDRKPNPEQLLLQSELHSILNAAACAIPRGFRAVFALRHLMGLSTEETAECLNLTTEGVKARLLRARKMLRHRLNEALHESDLS